MLARKAIVGREGRYEEGSSLIVTKPVHPWPSLSPSAAGTRDSSADDHGRSPPFRERYRRLEEWFGMAPPTCENQRELSLQRVKTSSIEVGASPEETG